MIFYKQIKRICCLFVIFIALGSKDLKAKKTIGISEFKISGIESKSNSWIGFAMQDFLTTTLAQDPAINVVEKSQIKEIMNTASMEQLMGAEEIEGQEALSELKSIDNIVLGSIIVMGSKDNSPMQVNFRIIAMKDSKVLYSSSLKTNMSKLFDVQEKLSKGLIYKLSDPSKYKVTKRITNSLGAYRFYTLAKQASSQEEKHKLFSEAINLDNDFIDAMIGKAQTYFIKSRKRKSCKKVSPLLSRALKVYKANLQTKTLPADWHYLNGYCFLFAYNSSKNEAYKLKAASELELFLKKADSVSLTIRGARVKRKLRSLNK